jgi:hypothetical protein
MGMAAGSAWAQSGSQGTIAVTVMDSSGGVVHGAALELVDLSTNDTRKATTHENGAYVFVNLNIGNYKLTVEHQGFSAQAIEPVVVHAALTTDVTVTLKVGVQTEVVEVRANAMVPMETTSNAIGTVVDMKQIEDLPLIGRNLTQMATLTPGYTGDNGGAGSWNGQPLLSQGSNIDGTMGSASRMKMFGNIAPAVAPRIEAISEMTVQTDQLDLDQGFGESVMQANFVTRRGTNQFHGRVFDNFHNSGLNANSWRNDATGQSKAKSIFNDMGGAIGGPILKDKLFFFGSYAEIYVPGGYSAFATFLTANAQNGIFKYTDTTGTVQTVNLLDIAHGYSSSLPNTVNTTVGNQLSAITKSLGSGTASYTGSDPNFGSVSWYNQNVQTTYIPTIRVDYNASEKVRMSLSWSMNEFLQPGAYAAPFPGSDFSDMTAGYKDKNYTASFGLDWTVSPRIINQFKLGFLYNTNFFAYNAKPLYTDLVNHPTVNWGLASYGSSGAGNDMSGENYQLPTTSYYPAFSLLDTVAYQRRSHTIKFGISGKREQDHYWNPPGGFPSYSLGLAPGDPALDAFTTGTLPNASNSSILEAQQLYAVLAGRISGVGGAYGYDPKTGGYPPKIGSFALDEVSTAWGWFAEDSWRVSPNLTLNYGLRWDFTGASKDKTGLYHSSDPTSVYGPTAVGDLFNPGSLKGNQNPTVAVQPQPYAPWRVSPQPAVGLAWNPNVDSGFLAKLLGGSSTVFRAGFSLRRMTEPYQYYWNNVSDQAAFYYQSFALNANNTGTPGSFPPGTKALGDTLPAYILNPANYQKSMPQAAYTFLGNCPGCGSPGVTGIDPHIHQPYTMAWNFGIQRRLGSRVLEIRYNGNRTLHLWVNNNTNEVNIFENGFLAEFKKAQANLTAYQAANPNCGASGTCSFANIGLPGQSALPIMTQAFQGEGLVGGQLADFTNGSFITDLQTGQAGALAGALSGLGTTTYLCNLVGSSFTPCVTNAGYTGGAGGGYPINFFQANPYAAGFQTQYMTAAGYSNYNALQVDLRQQQWQGLQFDANYTYSKTLGYQVNNNGPGGVTCGIWVVWCDWPDTVTLRDPHMAYGPAEFDFRHVFHFSGTYDFPLGKGKTFLNGNGVASRLLGNWTLGTIATFQTGAPVLLTSGNLTFNDYGDGGIRLTNVTVSQLQSAIGVYRVPGKTYALLINPKYLASANGSGGANTNFINPNTTPGTIGQYVYLYGPHAFYNDLSLSKSFPIFREIDLKLQVEASNIWNHPVFGSSSGGAVSNGTFGAGGNVQGGGWGTSGVTNTARVIELRLNISF